MKPPPEGTVCDVALKCCYAVLEFDAAAGGVNGPAANDEELDELLTIALDLATIAVAMAETDPQRN